MNGQAYATGGDVITRVDGKRVHGAGELQSAIDSKRPGDSVKLIYVRAGHWRQSPVGSRKASLLTNPPSLPAPRAAELDPPLGGPRPPKQDEPM